MAENLLKRPQKGILKTSSSFEQQEAQRRAQDIKWDEMNILQTLHPPDKDYGHMKIEEPKTPYNYYKDEVDGEVPVEREPLDLNLLAKKIEMGSEALPKAMLEGESDSEDELANETEEEREKRKLFEQKRKSHYNEYYAVKLARKLMQNDDDEDDDENNGNEEVKTESLSSETNEMLQDETIIESKI